MAWIKKAATEAPQEFIDGYLECALWTSDDSEEGRGEFLDATFGVRDIAPESMQKAVEECNQFYAANSKDLDSVENMGKAGHDFWLTRNGHGAGFWEKSDYEEEMGKRLTESSKSFGEKLLYVGDDGKLYFS